MRIILVVLTAFGLLAAAALSNLPRPIDGEFRFTSTGSISTLDPAGMSWVQDLRLAGLLYEGLFAADPVTMQPRPACAERVEISADRTEYQFHLRPNARWSNGERVTADDFLFAWRRAIEPGTAADYAFFLHEIAGVGDYVAWRWREIERIGAAPPAERRALLDRHLAQADARFEQTVGLHADGPDVLRVTLRRPVAYWLDVVSFAVSYPLHQASVERFRRVSGSGLIFYDEQWARPGRTPFNGPFTLADWQFKRGMRLEKNASYWDASRVRLNSVAYLDVADGNTAWLMYSTGRLDWLPTVETGFAPALAAQAADRPADGGMRADEKAKATAEGGCATEGVGGMPAAFVRACSAPARRMEAGGPAGGGRATGSAEGGRAKGANAKATAEGGCATEGVGGMPAAFVRACSAPARRMEAGGPAGGGRATGSAEGGRAKGANAKATAEGGCATRVAEGGSGAWRRDIHVQPVFGTYYYNFNCNARLPDGTLNPFADARVRRAFTRAVDRAALVRHVTRCGERPVEALVPTGIVPNYPQVGGLTFDTAAARAELAAAGYPDGRGFPRVRLIYSTEGQHGRIAESIAGMWRDALNVETRLVGKEVQSFREDKRNQHFMIARASWYGDYLDPTSFLDTLRSDNGNNDSAFRDSAYDAALDAADTARDPAERLARLADAERYLVCEAAPVLPLFQYVHINAFDPQRVVGLKMNPRMVFSIKDLEVRP